MIVANHAQTKQLETLTSLPLKFRRESKSEDPVVFADIYQEQTNIAIWRRSLTEQLKSDVNRFLDSNPTFQTSTVVTKAWSVGYTIWYVLTRLSRTRYSSHLRFSYYSHTPGIT